MLALQKALFLSNTLRSARLFGSSPPKNSSLSNLSTLLATLRNDHATHAMGPTTHEEVINLSTVRSTMRALLSDGNLLEILLLDRELRRPLFDHAKGRQQVLGALVADVEVATIVGIARAWASDSTLAIVPPQDSLGSSTNASLFLASSSPHRRTKDSSKESLVADPLRANRLLLQGFVHRQRWRQAAEVAAVMSEKDVEEAFLHGNRRVGGGGGDLQMSNLGQSGVYNIKDVTKSGEKASLPGVVEEEGVEENVVHTALRPCITALEEALGSASSSSKFATFFNHFLNANINSNDKSASSSSSLVVKNSSDDLKFKKALMLDILMLRVKEAEHDLALRIDVAAAVSSLQTPSSASSMSPSTLYHRTGSATSLFSPLISTLPLSIDFCNLFSTACVTIQHDNGAAWLLKRIDAMTLTLGDALNSSSSLLTLPMIRAASVSSSSSSLVNSTSVSTDALFLPLIHSLDLIGLGKSMQTSKLPLSAATTATTTTTSPSSFHADDLLIASIPISSILACVYLLAIKGRYQEALDGANIVVRIHALRQRRNNDRKENDESLSSSQTMPSLSATTPSLSPSLRKRGEFHVNFCKNSDLNQLSAAVEGMNGNKGAPPTVAFAAIEEAAKMVFSNKSSSLSSSSSSSLSSNSQVIVPSLLRGLLQREAPVSPLAHTSSQELLQQQSKSASEVKSTPVDRLYYLVDRSSEATTSSALSFFDVKDSTHWRSALSSDPGLALLVLFSLFKMQRFNEVLMIWSMVKDVITDKPYVQQQQLQQVPLTATQGDANGKFDIAIDDDLISSIQEEHHNLDASDSSSDFLFPLTTSSIASLSLNTLGSHNLQLFKDRCRRSHAFSILVMESCLALGKEEEAEVALQKFATSVATSYARNNNYTNGISKTTLLLPSSLITSALSVVKARVVATSSSSSSSAFSFADTSRWLRFLSSSSSSTTTAAARSSMRQAVSSPINDSFFKIALLSYTKALSSIDSSSLSLSSSSSVITTTNEKKQETLSDLAKASFSNTATEFDNESNDSDATDAQLLSLQASFIRLISDLCNAGVFLSPEMGEQLLLASFGIIKPTATSSNNITEGEGREQINAVRAWASCSKNHSSSISTTITSTNATPLIVCRQILNSSSLLNVYTSNDHPHLFLRFLTLLTHATSAVADEIKLRAFSVGTATSTTSTTASSSSSSIPLSAHRADKFVVDHAYRDITSALSHSLLTQAPLTASTAEVKKLAALHHNCATFRLLFDVISASWSFDISSSSTPTPPPPSHADRFSALQHVDSRSINAAADCMLWTRGSQKESLAVSDDQLDEKNRKTFTSLISIPSFRSVDYAALYYAAASYSFHRSVKGHQSLFSRGGGGGGGRFIHPLSSSSSNQLNINGHRNYEDNNYNNDVSHVSRTVRVLLDESSQSSDHHHHHDSLTFNDRIDDRAVTMFNPLDVSAASLSDLCLHLISSQRSQLWTLVRVLSRISLPGADAPISSFSLSSASSSSSSSLVRHRQESRSLLSSKVIVPAALQVKSRKHYSALHDLISAGKFDETVKTLFVSISTPSTANTQRSSASLTNNSVTQLIASKQTGVNLAPGSVKSSWLAMLSRKNSSTSTSPSSSSSSNAFSRFRLSQTSVADLVGGRRAVPPSPLSGVSTSLDRTINWGRLNYISDEDLKNVNKKDKGGDNVYSDEIITSNVVSDKNMSNNASNHVTSGGSMIDSSIELIGKMTTPPERLVEEGGGGGLLAAQMAALQSHTHPDSQEEASIFGDSIISLEKSPLTHVNSAVINDAVLAHLRNSALSSTPHIAPLIINELMRHGVFISPPLADLIAAMAANQFPPSSTSSSSLVAANEDDDKDSTSASLSSMSPLSSFSNHLYLLPLLTHLRAQAAAVISDLPGASQLQKHVPVLGSGLGSAGINHVLNACAAVGALSVAMEILDETAPLYIIPGVSGSAATPTIGSSISSVASRSASVEPIVNRNVWTPDLDALSSLKLLAVKERESGVAIALDILIKKETISNSGGVNSSASSFSFGEGIRGVRSGVEKRDATSSSTLPLQPSQQHQHQHQQ